MRLNMRNISYRNATIACKTIKYIETILRKTFKGYLNCFDFIAFEKIVSKQSNFVSDRTTNMQFGQNAKSNLRVTIQYYTKSTNPLYPKTTSNKSSV